MDSLDKAAIETAKRALSGGKFDWQAYLLLAVAEMRSARTQSDESSGRKVEAGRFDAMLECYSAGDEGAFDDMLSFLESAMSELVVNERGDRKKKAIDACKRLSCVR